LLRIALRRAPQCLATTAFDLEMPAWGRDCHACLWQTHKDTV